MEAPQKRDLAFSCAFVPMPFSKFGSQDQDPRPAQGVVWAVAGEVDLGPGGCLMGVSAFSRYLWLVTRSSLGGAHTETCISKSGCAWSSQVSCLCNLCIGSLTGVA